MLDKAALSEVVRFGELIEEEGVEEVEKEGVEEELGDRGDALGVREDT